MFNYSIIELTKSLTSIAELNRMICRFHMYTKNGIPSETSFPSVTSFPPYSEIETGRALTENTSKSPIALLVDIDEKVERMDRKLIESLHEFTLNEELV